MFFSERIIRMDLGEKHFFLVLFLFFFPLSTILIIFASSHILPGGCHVCENAKKTLKFGGEIQAFICSSANPSRTAILCKFFALIKHSLIVISPSLASPPLPAQLPQWHSSLH